MNKDISESLSQAKEYLNGVETDGEVSIDIADRILGSCKCFIHPPHSKDFDEFNGKIDAEFEMKMKEAKDANSKEKDTYLKYLNMAQFVINLRLEKTQRMINFLDKLNEKLQ